MKKFIERHWEYLLIFVLIIITLATIHIWADPDNDSLSESSKNLLTGSLLVGMILLAFKAVCKEIKERVKDM